MSAFSHYQPPTLLTGPGRHDRASWRDDPAQALAQAIKDQPWSALVLVGALLCFSVVCVHSASYDSSTGLYLPYAEKQLRWIAVGLVAFVAIQFIPYRRLLQLAPLGYILGIAALCLVFVIGTMVNGSRRWFSFGSVRVQPSEFMKLALVLTLARILGESEGALEKLKGWIAPALLTALPFVLVLRQPDLGTATTFLPIVAVALYLAGARRQHLGLAAGAGLAAVPLAWMFVLRDYQKMRVLSFLDPEAQARAGAYQQLQAIIGIGAGGVFGRGYEQGTQGRLGFCPERHTDFIFAVVGEEFGLVGGLLLLLVYAGLLVGLIRLAAKAPDTSGRVLIAGVATVFFMQTAVNIGMNTGCGPITGLTLPFMSYGGSSMLSSFIGMGLVAAAARQKPKVFGRR